MLRITILIVLISIDVAFSRKWFFFKFSVQNFQSNFVVVECSVNIRQNIATKDPVYLRELNGVYNLWSPNGPTLNWSAGETTQIACTGSGNSIILTGVTTSPITCSSGLTFLLNGQNQESINLECANTITGQIEQTSTQCWRDTATLQKIGFQTTNNFVTYIDVCYSMITGSAKYTRHVIPGQSIDYSVIESSRPSFKSTGTPSHVSPATSYTQAQQLIRLTELLGSQEQASKFIYTNSYLARGHLAPDGDGIFRSWQFSTYFYSNAAPQWQVVNAGNWLRVENAARDKASSSQTDLLIFTGNEEILTLPHLDGREISITLESGGNIEVPKWFWKIIKNPLTNSGIALITLNNPFAISVNSLCSDICSSYGWSNVNYSDYSKGFTYCCSVQSLMAAVPGIPTEASVANILSF